MNNIWKVFDRFPSMDSKYLKTPLAPIASHGSAEDLNEDPDFMEADEVWNKQYLFNGKSGADAINKFQSNITMICWNILSLTVQCHVTSTLFQHIIAMLL